MNIAENVVFVASGRCASRSRGRSSAGHKAAGVKRGPSAPFSCAASPTYACGGDKPAATIGATFEECFSICSAGTCARARPSGFRRFSLISMVWCRPTAAGFLRDALEDALPGTGHLTGDGQSQAFGLDRVSRSSCEPCSILSACGFIGFRDGILASRFADLRTPPHGAPGGLGAIERLITRRRPITLALARVVGKACNPQRSPRPRAPLRRSACAKSRPGGVRQNSRKPVNAALGHQQDELVATDAEQGLVAAHGASRARSPTHQPRRPPGGEKESLIGLNPSRSRGRQAGPTAATLGVGERPSSLMETDGGCRVGQLVTLGQFHQLHRGPACQIRAGRCAANFLAGDHRRTVGDDAWPVGEPELVFLADRLFGPHRTAMWAR